MGIVGFRGGEDVEEKLIKTIKRYQKKGLSFEDFDDDLGWQDWMNAYTDAEEGEEISEREGDEIEEDLKKLWDYVEYEF